MSSLVGEYNFSRTSHEVRGLKFIINKNAKIINRSHLTRGAWIEMVGEYNFKLMSKLSHLTRGAWIEISVRYRTICSLMSHLTRGAWIEIFIREEKYDGYCVAPHTRCVD